MKKFALLMLLVCCLTDSACAKEISEILTDYADFAGMDSFAEKYGADFSMENIEILFSTDSFPSWKEIAGYFLAYLAEPLRKIGKTAASMALPVLMLILNSAVLPDSSASAGFICRISLSRALIGLFASVLDAAGECLRITADFSDAVAPVLAAVLTASGKPGFSAFISPAAALAGNLAEQFYLKYGLPLCACTGCISLAANLGEGLDLRRLTGVIKRIFSWSSGLSITLFTALIFLRGSGVSVADNLALRTAKYAVDSASPVIGSGVSDAWDSYLAGLAAARSVAGISGTALLLSVCLKPMLFMASAMIFLSLSASVFDMFGEKLAAGSCDQLSGACRMALTLCGSAMAVWIILMGAAMSLGWGIG